MICELTRLAMWNRSKPHQYTDFRTFIFGITSQTMFPHGVLYEGERTSTRHLNISH